MVSSRSADKLNTLSFTIGGYDYILYSVSVKGPDKAENQDSFGFSYTPGRLTTVVADGLGSATRSSIGSSIAVSCTLEISSGGLDVCNWPIEIFRLWKQHIDEKPEEYDTTDKFVSIGEIDTIIGSIGDGWICIRTDYGVEEITSNNIFSNQTDSMLSFDYKDKFIIRSIDTESIRTVLLATDGFSEDFDKSNGVGLLDEIGKSIDEDPIKFGEELIDMMNNWAVRTNMDDKTVIIIHRVNKDE